MGFGTPIALIRVTLSKETPVDKGIYIAMTGARHIEHAQALRANNLANATTTAFRADFAQARAMGVYYGDGHPTRAYALTENPGTDFSQGSLLETGRDLDVAVNGEGWLAVMAPDGSEAYTRAGNLQINTLGQLMTADGRPVLGDAGPIAIPPYEKLQIGHDGTISIRPEGQGPEVLAEVARIKLVNPDQALTKGGDGLFRGEAGVPLPADAGVRLQTGYLEGSNVNTVEEFTQVISLSRQFELQVKLMKSVEDNTAAATRLLQVNG